MLKITKITKTESCGIVRKKVTIQEIADATGLSKYAVSRALAGKSGVSSETRQYIIQTAEHLGYFSTRTITRQQSAPPPSSDGSWSGTVLILFPDVRYQNTDSLYWGPIFNGISSALNKKGFNILTLTEPSNDSIFTLLNPGAIQGIISVGSISTSLLLELKRSSIPVVMVDHSDHEFVCDSIFSDNMGAISQIMNELCQAGYRRFQFIGNIQEAPSFKERWIAFRSSLEERNIPLKQNFRLISEEVEDIHTVIPKVLEEDGLPEVFVCANDIYADFTIEALGHAGYEVPRDCIFTGFDYTHPGLPLYATMNVKKELLGKRSVEQLLWRIMNPDQPYERKLLHADLIVNKHFSSIRS
nr:LacI family DNA-binding transcriptional regulator [Paenibacillus camelliae]